MMLKKIRSMQNLNLKTIFNASVLLGFLLVLTQNVIFAQGELHGTSSFPVYPGGTNALKEFIVKNIQYPLEAKKAGISGIVWMSFMVTKDGNVEQVKVTRGISPECDNEAIRVTQLITGWKPGLQQGKPINIMVSMPVKFPSDKELEPIIITGKVTCKSTCQPVEGAMIIVKGTMIGTITDANGNYRLEVPGDRQYLKIISIGFDSKEEPIGMNTTINVELETAYYVIDFNAQKS
jgi:TonB family protein